MDGVRPSGGHRGCMPMCSGANADRFRCRWVQWPMGLWADEVGTDVVGTDGVRGGWV